MPEVELSFQVSHLLTEYHVFYEIASSCYKKKRESSQFLLETWYFRHCHRKEVNHEKEKLLKMTFSALHVVLDYISYVLVF